MVSLNEIEIKWIVIIGICLIIIIFLTIMVIIKTSKLTTAKEFSDKLETDYNILKIKYENATEMMKDLSLMMNRFQKNVQNYKKETEEYIELLKQDTDYKKN